MWNRRIRRNRRKPAEESRRLPAVNWVRVVRSAVTLVILAAAAALGIAALDRPIQSVSITGSFQRVSPLDVERAVQASVHGAGLVTVSLAAVSAAVEHLPWVDSARVERSWPHGLIVRIVEQVPAARWVGGGLINTRGELFTADVRHVPSELPALSGPAGSEPDVAQRYLAMQGRLAEMGMRVTALRLDARGSWEFDLDDGVTVRLGRRQVDERFETFITVAAKIVAQRASDIGYVDMRYTNGFAIGWRADGSSRSPKGGDSAHDA